MSNKAMILLDEYDDDALIKWEIVSRMEHAINAGAYQRINLHNLALSLKEPYKIENIARLLQSISLALEDNKGISAGQWPYEDMNDGTPFAQDEDYYCLVKASSEDEVPRKEQAIREWLDKTSEMLKVIND